MVMYEYKIAFICFKFYIQHHLMIYLKTNNNKQKTNVENLKLVKQFVLKLL